MKPDWILIANSTRARLMQMERNERVTELETFVHPQSRIKVSDLVDDRAGHESTDRSYGGTSYQPRTDARQKEHQRFAREIAEFLERQAHSGSYRSLAVFASSPFLGELKAAVGAATIKLMSGTHDLDLTSVGVAELGRRLAREMAH